jgi:hypothetical protein
LPQGCNEPPPVDLLKRGDHGSPAGYAIRFEHNGINRDVLPILMFWTYRSHPKRLHDTLCSRIESDRRVFADNGAVQRARGDKEPEERLFLGRRTAGQRGEAPQG